MGRRAIVPSNLVSCSTHKDLALEWAGSLDIASTRFEHAHRFVLAPIALTIAAVLASSLVTDSRIELGRVPEKRIFLCTTLFASVVIFGDVLERDHERAGAIGPGRFEGYLRAECPAIARDLL